MAVTRETQAVGHLCETRRICCLRTEVRPFPGSAAAWLAGCRCEVQRRLGVVGPSTGPVAPCLSDAARVALAAVYRAPCLAGWVSGCPGYAEVPPVNLAAGLQMSAGFGVWTRADLQIQYRNISFIMWPDVSNRNKKFITSIKSLLYSRSYKTRLYTSEYQFSWKILP